MTLMSSDVSVLLLVLNAAVDSPTMLPLFPHHLSSHYTCLRNTLPHMVPSLPVSNHCLTLFPHHLSSHFTCLLNTLSHMVPSLPVRNHCLTLFPHYLSSHYTCLLNTLPHMVPSLPVSNCSLVSNDHTVSNILSIVRLFGVHLFSAPCVLGSIEM